MLVLIVTLTVLWNVVLAHDYQRFRDLAAESEAFHWTLIAVGSLLFLAIIVLSSVLGIQLFASIRWRNRQADFLATVSHELNSPLSSIKLFAQTLRRGDLDPADRAGFVSKILFDVGRLSRIIANILRAAEADNRGEELQVALQEVELGKYLHDYVDDARALYEGKLELELTGEREARASIDPMMFRQVLDNLVDNAVRYRGSGVAQMEFRLLRPDGWVELEAIDQGVGIPEEELGLIFDRFYRAENLSPDRRRRGMGIGLDVVRTIIRGHGGEVGARSEGPGKGTAIWVRIPGVEEPAAPESVRS
ncbi:MAG: sensor histidine kinase [Planctomycetota bacterium]